MNLPCNQSFFKPMQRSGEARFGFAQATRKGRRRWFKPLGERRSRVCVCLVRHLVEVDNRNRTENKLERGSRSQERGQRCEWCLGCPSSLPRWYCGGGHRLPGSHDVTVTSIDMPMRGGGWFADREKENSILAVDFDFLGFVIFLYSPDFALSPRLFPLDAE
jgi:hypothetical protein